MSVKKERNLKRAAAAEERIKQGDNMSLVEDNEVVGTEAVEAEGTVEDKGTDESADMLQEPVNTEEPKVDTELPESVVSAQSEIVEPTLVEPTPVEVVPEPELPPVAPEAVVIVPEEITPPVEPLVEPTVLVVTGEPIVFDKKTINALILGYESIEVDADKVTVLNSIENKKARALIDTLYKASIGTKYTMATKTLEHLSIFMADTTKEKDSGLLFQLLAKGFNDAKSVDEIDMSIFILTRLFKNVRSFSFNVILKGINSGYHPEFKVNALQMHEVFKELGTQAERDMKIDKTVSFANKADGRGKALGVSNVFLNQNGSKLLTQYFTEK